MDIFNKKALKEAKEELFKAVKFKDLLQQARTNDDIYHVISNDFISYIDGYLARAAINYKEALDVAHQLFGDPEKDTVLPENIHYSIHRSTSSECHKAYDYYFDCFDIDRYQDIATALLTGNPKDGYLFGVIDELEKMKSIVTGRYIEMMNREIN